MWANRRIGSYWVLACSLWCLPLAISWAEDRSSGVLSSPSRLPDLSTMNSELPPTDPWTSFDSAWNNLKHELTQWSEDSQLLYTLLEALQTEAGGLRSSLRLSTEQLLASEAARLQERQATEALIAAALRRSEESERRALAMGLRADQAVKSRRLWRGLAIAAFGLGTLGWITAWTD